MKKWMTEREIIKDDGTKVTQFGEYILAYTQEQAIKLCPPGWTVSEWWVVSEIDYPEID